MNNVEVWWRDRSWREHSRPLIGSTAVSELVELLEREAPDGVVLRSSADDAPFVIAGMRAGRGAMYFADKDGHEWYTCADVRGEPEGEPPVYVSVDFPPGSEIPRADLEKALAEYLSRGERPSCVKWQIEEA
ncbi:Immunity protein Imm1 [Streptoalloteichus tenebrarius]|uniref:Immunity protein Imm1 n=1 Tax=Streptoalloteichus tenebrarius (strain ATCC 17920 / DSM 40477 / JCM 4838 / CBS 697.72 / NBRC 16177 / NCIMB 11028 / NRRL B-12390 / A12253. 1 / ISP 5477) TaxID=1933 RepID=A0ABT1I4L5_STRSD|nr:Imm1 family immunity protein [Streptoalloteichus tenebrarius]MCP2262673.1 Immunity protein Imm1 [Streptoalloteichus tenebrarius]BFF04652.1 hypothetical protein GCM10020241_63270 [Streptoalloteichus tenebrarius]